VPWFDMPEPQLREYRVTTVEPAGLDSWWAQRIESARGAARPVELSRYAPEVYGEMPVYDVEFSGANGDRVKGWYLRPAGSDGQDLPVVVTYIGYGGGRGLPVEHTRLPAAGFAQLVMDTRGQGGSWTVGATGDPGGGTGPQHPGVMTRGLADPSDYYYTRLFVDAVRAIDVAAELPGVDAERIGVCGASQGGGLSLAAAALSGDRVHAVQSDVPFLCDLQRAITVAPAGPYPEIPRFLAQHVDLVEAARNTLRYIDCALLARRITGDCLLSTGLMDDVCPPSTVFGAYNEITAPKDIAVSQFGGHTVPSAHIERGMAFLRERLFK
jgi:cephalosporin-C deacetylase